MGLGKECESVLRTVPEWFGREDSIQHYIEDINKMETSTAWHNDQLIGFYAVNFHFPKVAELHVLAVRKEYHRAGIGGELYKRVEDELKEKGAKFIQVKTLSPRAKNVDYQKTYEFYMKHGFTPLEDFDELWGEDTPSIQLIKGI
ncbi:GCN5 family acetyltransferase [Endozoicomonas numazuensis]|uniref:GCN5 family acetyltransferase n=1 Tax=Endozoicomonas numazuensis TaxID=1137799 RepID=A0A081NFT3_9GAMM|nr:GCN5 family acetyltransferase [Endozoicomonas numazuensis]